MVFNYVAGQALKKITSIKFIVFGLIASSIPASGYEGTRCLCIHFYFTYTLKMEATCYSETLVPG
jgi:hypothetical protein